MKKTFLTIIFSLFFISQSSAAVTKVYGDGFLEMIGDLPVLHVKGNEYEMGKQYGYLAGDKIAANVVNLKAIGAAQEPKVKLLPDMIFTWLRKTVGWVFWLTYPANVKTHIKGIVDGAKEAKISLNRYDVSFINALIDVVGIAKANIGELPGKKSDKSEESFLLKVLGLSWINHNCDSMAVWGDRTVDGKTFQTRNTDITTGVGMERYPLVVVYKAEGKIPFVTAAFAGMVGIFTGMNAHGLALGQVWAFSKDVKVTTPWHLSVRKIFSETATAKEALYKFKQMNTTTYGNNFVVADAGGHSDDAETGYSIEMSGKNFASFTENDPGELVVNYNGETYGYPIDNAVFRGDVSFDPKVRAHQLSANGPEGDPRGTGSYSQRYKGQYDRIVAFEEKGVLIGKEQAESVSRETAMRGTSLQTAVYANTDREMWVSYAKILEDGTSVQAYEQEYVNIPFKDYLADLKIVNGELRIRNWFKARQGLTLRHVTNSKMFEEKIDLQAKSTLMTGIQLSKGDVVELYENNKLIDRLVK